MFACLNVKYVQKKQEISHGERIWKSRSNLFYHETPILPKQLLTAVFFTNKIILKLRMKFKLFKFFLNPIK